MLLYICLRVCIYLGTGWPLGSASQSKGRRESHFLDLFPVRKLGRINYKTLGLSLAKQLRNILIWLLSKRVALKWSCCFQGGEAGPLLLTIVEAG